jgi:hypothetical protein
MMTVFDVPFGSTFSMRERRFILAGPACIAHGTGIA